MSDWGAFGEGLNLPGLATNYVQLMLMRQEERKAEEERKKRDELSRSILDELFGGEPKWIASAAEGDKGKTGGPEDLYSSPELGMGEITPTGKIIEQLYRKGDAPASDVLRLFDQLGGIGAMFEPPKEPPEPDTLEESQL